MNNKKNNLSVLFIGKTGDPFSGAAAAFIQRHFHEPLIVWSQRAEPFPKHLLEWKGDLLISYLSQWIIPAAVLQNAGFAAINFHPGPPEYPGIGCTNFALYNEEKQFGITCHHMEAKVDTGDIIDVRRFPVLSIDTVYTITQRCYIEIFHSFYGIMRGLLMGDDLPVSNESWKRAPYTRKQLNELCVASTEMTASEIQKRLKATTFGDKIWLQIKNGEEIIPYESAIAKGLI
jgi:methionyl-tRNA formyltransferase